MLYTVIGHYENGQICADIVDGSSGEEALRKAAGIRCEGGDAPSDGYNLVAAIKGNHPEDDSITYPGDSLVDAEGYLALFEDAAADEERAADLADIEASEETKTLPRGE